MLRPIDALFDELALLPGVREMVIAIDMALAAHIVTLADLQAGLESRTGMRSIRLIREAIAAADSFSASPKESELRLIWTMDAGLPRPVCNPWVLDQTGAAIGKADLLDPDAGVVGEYDGAEHRLASRRSVDAKKDDLYRRVGLESFRVVGPDIGDRALVAARISAAYERAIGTSARWSWRR